jgi:hypothetical protein
MTNRSATGNPRFNGGLNCYESQVPTIEPIEEIAEVAR